jgi:small subunit ribosomal protein S2
VSETAEKHGIHYVNKRWLGGLLTNFPMVKKSIDKLLELDEMKRDGRWEVRSKKEQSRMEKVYKKLYKNLWGIRNMESVPGVIIVIDSNFEEIAVLEAQKLNIPIVAIVDTNSNPEKINYPVPGNDDAIRSIKLFTSKFCEAVKEGLDRRISDSLNQEKTVETSKNSDTSISGKAESDDIEIISDPNSKPRVKFSKLVNIDESVVDSEEKDLLVEKSKKSVKPKKSIQTDDISSTDNTDLSNNNEES